MAKKMLAKEQIHILGSDTHNLTDRAPNMGAALEMIEKSLPAFKKLAEFYGLNK